MTGCIGWKWNHLDLSLDVMLVKGNYKTLTNYLSYMVPWEVFPLLKLLLNSALSSHLPKPLLTRAGCG